MSDREGKRRVSSWLPSSPRTRDGATRSDSCLLSVGEGTHLVQSLCPRDTALHRGSWYRRPAGSARENPRPAAARIQADQLPGNGLPRWPRARARRWRLLQSAAKVCEGLQATVREGWEGGA